MPPKMTAKETQAEVQAICLRAISSEPGWAGRKATTRLANPKGASSVCAGAARPAQVIKRFNSESNLFMGAFLLLNDQSACSIFGGLGKLSLEYT
jgi:hypothetical protein